MCMGTCFCVYVWLLLYHDQHMPKGCFCSFDTAFRYPAPRTTFMVSKNSTKQMINTVSLILPMPSGEGKWAYLLLYHGMCRRQKIGLEVNPHTHNTPFPKLANGTVKAISTTHLFITDTGAIRLVWFSFGKKIHS